MRRAAGCLSRFQRSTKKTESVEILVEGEDIGFDALAECISGMGASVHSIDAVEVRSESDTATSSRSNTD